MSVGNYGYINKTPTKKEEDTKKGKGIKKGKKRRKTEEILNEVTIPDPESRDICLQCCMPFSYGPCGCNEE